MSSGDSFKEFEEKKHKIKGKLGSVSFCDPLKTNDWDQSDISQTSLMIKWKAAIENWRLLQGYIYELLVTPENVPFTTWHLFSLLRGIFKNG